MAEAEVMAGKYLGRDLQAVRGWACWSLNENRPCSESGLELAVAIRLGRPPSRIDRNTEPVESHLGIEPHQLLILQQQ